MTRFRIFIVDDEETVREGLSLYFRKNHQVSGFATAEEALEEMGRVCPDLLLLDIGLPGMDGIDALVKARNMHPELLVIMITAYEDVETVVSAMRRGAYDYVVKPIRMETLLVTVQNALDSIKMKKEIQQLQKRCINDGFPCFIGESNAISDVMDVVEKVAKSADTPVLILGKTGTGKELIASAIHYRSPNYNGPFVSINCAAIPTDLVESELFGYEKGAFSGADSAGKEGLVEKAHKGTLFLDEVGDLSPPAQAKLLRFLEEGEFFKVGSTRKIHVNTRIVASTNRDVDAMVESGNFREDLYYRLAVVKVELPSLAQRKDDILPISKHFLLQYQQKFKKNFTGFSPKAALALKAHPWRGNVRELRNIIERAALICEEALIDVNDLGLGKSAGLGQEKNGNHFSPIPDLSHEGIDFPEVMAAIEAKYFEKALTLAQGNESRAARLLNLSRDTFRYRKRKMDLP